MQLSIDIVGIRKFSWSRTTKLIATEMSELRGFDTMRRLYDDACDVGFAVWNPTTQRLTRWVFSSDSHDNEGDLLTRVFVPAPETLRKHPELEGWKIHLFND